MNNSPKEEELKVLLKAENHDSSEDENLGPAVTAKLLKHSDPNTRLNRQLKGFLAFWLFALGICIAFCISFYQQSETEMDQFMTEFEYITYLPVLMSCLLIFTGLLLRTNNQLKVRKPHKF